VSWRVVSDVPAEGDAAADGLLRGRVGEEEEGERKGGRTRRMMMAVIQTQRESWEELFFVLRSQELCGGMSGGVR